MREKQQKRFVRRIGVGGYQLSDGGKGKKKVELFHLCIAALKQKKKLAASGKDHKTLLDSKTHAFFNISKFLSSVCMQPCFRCSLVII